MKRKRKRKAGSSVIDRVVAIDAFAVAAREFADASSRGQAVLDGVQAEHAIVEAAKAQAAAIVEPARKKYLDALQALSAAVAPPVT